MVEHRKLLIEAIVARHRPDLYVRLKADGVDMQSSEFREGCKFGAQNHSELAKIFGGEEVENGK